MIRFDHSKRVTFCDGWTRRDFLHVGSLSCAGLSLSQFNAMASQGKIDEKKEKNCIMLGDISNQHLLHEDTSANSIIDHCFSVQLLPLWVPGQKI